MARAVRRVKMERDESPAPSEDSMSSPARLVSMTSVSSSASSVISQSSEQSCESDNERSAMAAADDEEETPVNNTSPEKLVVETKSEAMVAEPPRQQTGAVTERKMVSPSVSRSGSPSIADMLLEPPTPPRSPCDSVSSGAAVEEEISTMWGGMGAYTDEKLQWKVTTTIPNAVQQQQQAMEVEQEAPLRGIQGAGESLPTVSPALHQISSQPWEIAAISTGLRFPVPVMVDKGQQLSKQHRGPANAFVSVAPAALTPVAAPAPSSFGGALLSQPSLDFRDVGLEMDVLVGEYQEMREMMPSLTREMSLARAVEALDNEGQGNGGMGDTITVFSPW